MDVYLVSVSLLFFISLATNLFLSIKLKNAKKTTQLTLDAQQLLHDITGGSALLKISVIDPGDILLRSPRG